MTRDVRWPRRLVSAGLIAMLTGILDPIEGSVVILAGTAVRRARAAQDIAAQAVARSSFLARLRA